MEANQELEDQYTPSLFSKRFATRDELIDHHLEFTKKGEKEKVSLGTSID